jgi:hypothetical protein
MGIRKSDYSMRPRPPIGQILHRNATDPHQLNVFHNMGAECEPKAANHSRKGRI